MQCFRYETLQNVNNRRLRDLEECERIQSLSDLIKIKIEDNNGRKEHNILQLERPESVGDGVSLFPKWACDVLDKAFDDDSTFLMEYRTE